MKSERTLTSSPAEREEELNNIIGLVLEDVNGSIPREVVCQTVTSIYSEYDQATVRRFIPLIVRRNANEALANGSGKHQ